MKVIYYSLVLFALLTICSCSQSQSQDSQNLLIDTSKSVLCERIPVPEKYKRVKSLQGSFAYYLQHLPLKEGNAEVRLYDGSKKGNQNIHAAIIKLDIGNRDLQQCADAIMRLQAEYLFDQKRYDEIGFNFVSDSKPRYLRDYCSDKTDYTCFRKYMNYVFSYANTRSLHGQLKPKTEFSNISIGDVLIQTGNPYGHAVLVVDMAKNPETGEVLFLLAQSYMPAQDIHVLKNLNDRLISRWYRVTDAEKISTPEWVFYKQDLRCFE